MAQLAIWPSWLYGYMAIWLYGPAGYMAIWPSWLDGSVLYYSTEPSELSRAISILGPFNRSLIHLLEAVSTNSDQTAILITGNPV